MGTLENPKKSQNSLLFSKSSLQHLNSIKASKKTGTSFSNKYCRNLESTKSFMEAIKSVIETVNKKITLIELLNNDLVNESLKKEVSATNTITDLVLETNSKDSKCEQRPAKVIVSL